MLLGNQIFACMYIYIPYTHTHTHTHTHTDWFTVLAVAVLEFRATNLFKATSLSEAEVRLFGSTMPWSNQVNMASTKLF